MPAMHYTIQWPDASTSVAYSPSLVIQDFFVPSQTYPVGDFLARIRQATAIANERVQAKFGFLCSRAGEQLNETEQRAHTFLHDPAAQVLIVSFDPA